MTVQTTAVQVLNELHTILRLIAAEPDVPTAHSDGVIRLITREWTFEQHLDVCIDEIAHWGRTSMQVPRRITDLLTQLEVVAQPEHRPAIADKAAAIRQLAAKSAG